MKRFSQTPPLRDLQCNITPMIDVVFLLIIFFMLICRFISSENYKLVIPDQCQNALPSEDASSNPLTVSVFPKSSMEGNSNAVHVASNSDILYAVRSSIVDPGQPLYQQSPDALQEDLAAEIIHNIRNKPESVVHLRADKDLTYGQVQVLLQSLAQAKIQKVRLAAIRTKTPASFSRNPLEP